MDKVYDAGSDSDGAGTTNYKSDFLDSHVDGSFDLVLEDELRKYVFPFVYLDNKSLRRPSCIYTISSTSSRRLVTLILPFSMANVLYDAPTIALSKHQKINKTHISA